MVDHKIFCMCLHDHHLENLKKINYIPVGLGQNKFSNDWLRDNSKDNISEKNQFYGEYTFYYWFWKNMLNKKKDKDWIGFTGYRYHWSQTNKNKSDEITKIVNKENFGDYILRKIPDEWENYEVILGEEININNWKLSKILKHGKKKFLFNPLNFLKSNQNIKLQFDVFHGNNTLDKAINMLNIKDREDFRKYVTTKNSFNRENLFFCNSKNLLHSYFQSVFSWLSECEKVFGFNLHGYSKKRMYAFLAERYLGFWFNKYAKPLSWPIFFFDTNVNKVKI